MKANYKVVNNRQAQLKKRSFRILSLRVLVRSSCSATM